MAVHPPDDYVLRDLGIESWRESETTSRAVIEVSEPLRDRTGAVSLGALATLVDVAGARVAFGAAHPHWIATADLTLSIGTPVREGTVVADATVIKSGSKLITVDVDLHDAGAAIASFSRIPRTAAEDEPVLLPIGVRRSMPRRVGPIAGTIGERIGFRRIGDDVEVALTDYVRNAFGTFNGGVMAFLAITVAEEISGFVSRDLTLRYLGQTTVGPARASATVIRSTRGHALCDVRVHDAEERPLARATVGAFDSGRFDGPGQDDMMTQSRGAENRRR